MSGHRYWILPDTGYHLVINRLLKNLSRQHSVPVYISV